VIGHDVVAEAAPVRAAMAMTGQFASLDEDLTGRENLVLVARCAASAGGQRPGGAGALLEAFGLADAAGRQVKA
jgi:ABC-2 type transport system ATP-binding protein